MAGKALREVAAVEVAVGQEYRGFRTGFTCSRILWEDVGVEVARAMGVGQMHLGVVQAFCTVTECRICLKEGLGRGKYVKAEAETGASMMMSVDLGMVGEGEVGVEEDRMEVDSAYAACAMD